MRHVTSRKGRVSRNISVKRDLVKHKWSRPARGV